tara:strand:- start:261 stop:1583 length:1323 start_codon:yes stop_codon:yes gene_type:complete
MSLQTASQGWKTSAFSKSLGVFGVGFLALGLLVMAVGASIDIKHFWHAYLVMFMFLLSLGLGALFYVALEYLVGAYWSVPIRRVTEAIAGLLIPVAFLAIPIFMGGMDHLYSHWIPHHGHHAEAHGHHGDEHGHDHEKNAKVSKKSDKSDHKKDSYGGHGGHHEPDPIVEGKRPFLSKPWFYVLNIGCLLIWIAFLWWFRSNSRAQDISGDQKYTQRNIVVSAPFMLVFAGTLTVAAIYYMMSLEPHWFSTMFGIYYFAGTLVSAASLLTIYAVKLHQSGFLHGHMKKDTYYSLGLMMFAFNVFWAYIAFSQFMLIWYANLYEETMWFLHRYEGGWATASWLLILFHFVIPFFALLSRNQKTNPKRLLIMAYWLLAAHIFDLYWIIVPAYPETSFQWYDLGFLMFAAGFVMYFFNQQLKGANLVPIKDPKLGHGLEFRIH